ncbi:T9SS type A sorting domain-containing protein [uncultured Winogradskyella sp.]|uniref:T9SS type A sorting domain-containing protein n=1 Tax=uncultured Winogradskyella sp. TaxID=395353 RepID=UPI00261805EB|nr:T9SS type A sorting domain-containing protein [uncultured Winogradskyella sp.]
MKKITFFIAMMTITFGFSQELITNGDFQTGMAGDWYSGGENQPIEIVDLGGGEFVFQANVASVTDAWRVNLSQLVDLEDNTTYDLTFDAFTDTATGTRTMTTTLGQAGAPFGATMSEELTLTDTPQTFNFSITTTFDTANTASDNPGSRLIFDMGADTGFVFIDNVSLVLSNSSCNNNGMMDGDETGVDCGGSNCAPCVVVPPGPAPLPTSPDGETLSLYDGNLAGDVTSFTTNWPFAYDFGNPPTEIDSDPGADVNGIWGLDLGVAGYGQGEGPIDASIYGFLSFDYWYTPNAGTSGFRFEIIHNNPSVQGFVYEIGPGMDDEETTVEEQWTKVVIPLSYFVALGFDETAFFQWKFDPYMQSVDNAGILYVDNILLTQNNPLSIDSFETSQFTAFPNPTTNNWNIKGNALINSIAVYDLLGKQVSALVPNATEATIDATSLNSGIYFARIEGLNGSQTVKLVKE